MESQIPPKEYEIDYLLNKWRYYLSELRSPDSYINIGFYFMITSALQRRVWFGEEGPGQRFPNMYYTLVGPPAVGKGLVIKQVCNILKFHKYKKSVEEQAEEVQSLAKEGGSKENMRALLDAGSGSYQRIESNATDCLIPIAPDSTTVEQLYKIMVSSIRTYKYEIVGLDGLPVKKKYAYKSLVFCLEELSSLIKRKKETTSIVDFMLKAYDCGDHDYETKHGQPDRIRKMCLNFMAAAAPSFLQDVFDQRLLDEGLSSRMIFVYESVPRHNRYCSALSFSQEQRDCLIEILQWIKQLTTLYGRIAFDETSTPDAHAIFKNYFEHTIHTHRVNHHVKLDDYYGRKEAHALKLATAIHFSHSLEMKLYPEDCIRALEILDDLETRMHNALVFGKNPLGPVTKAIKHYITHRCVDEQKPNVNIGDVLREFIQDARNEEIRQVLNHLVQTREISTTDNVNFSVKKENLLHDLNHQKQINGKPRMKIDYSITTL